MRSNRFLPLLAGLMAATNLACSSSSSMEPGSTPPAGDVHIVLDASSKGGNAFAPNPFSESLAVKGSVKWVNLDIGSGGYGGSTGVAHHIVSNTGLFDSGTLAPGASYTFTFAAAGSYPYHCSIHPTMTGTITINP
jgi:plastocyanin